AASTGDVGQSSIDDTTADEDGAVAADPLAVLLAESQKYHASALDLATQQTALLAQLVGAVGGRAAPASRAEALDALIASTKALPPLQPPSTYSGPGPNTVSVRIDNLVGNLTIRVEVAAGADGDAQGRAAARGLLETLRQDQALFDRLNVERLS